MNWQVEDKTHQEEEWQKTPTGIFQEKKFKQPINIEKMLPLICSHKMQIKATRRCQFPTTHTGKDFKVKY